MAIKVPRPMNSFMIYRLEKQCEIVKECPGANHRDISKIIAKWWKEMSDNEKELYRRKAETAREEHRRQYPHYRYSPKKRTKKTRAYKKRPQNEFTAIDYENRKQLFDIYRRRNCASGLFEKDRTPEKSEEINPSAFISEISSLKDKDSGCSVISNEYCCSVPPLLSCSYPASDILSSNPQMLMSLKDEGCYSIESPVVKYSSLISYSLSPPSLDHPADHRRQIIHTVDPEEGLAEGQLIYTHAMNCCCSQYTETRNNSYLYNRWDQPLVDYKGSQETSSMYRLPQQFHPFNPFLIHPFY